MKNVLGKKITRQALKSTGPGSVDEAISHVLLPARSFNASLMVIFCDFSILVWEVIRGENIIADYIAIVYDAAANNFHTWLRRLDLRLRLPKLFFCLETGFLKVDGS